MGITNIRVGAHMCTHGNTNTFPEICLLPPPTSNILECEVLIWSDLHLGIPEQMSLEVPGEASLIRVENVPFFSSLPPLLRQAPPFPPKSHYPGAATGPASPTFAVIKTNTRQERSGEEQRGGESLAGSEVGVVRQTRSESDGPHILLHALSLPSNKSANDM